MIENSKKKLKIGRSDVPIITAEEDKLFPKEQIDAFKSFLFECDTPMTISLQGEWGCGKTSFFNRIKNELEIEKKAVFKFIDFDIWEYAQFSIDDKLPIIMLTYLYDKVDLNSKVIKNTFKKLINLGTNIVTSKLYGNATGYDELIDKNVIDHISDLKKNFGNAVKKYLDGDNKKLVIFIDNLDRIEPNKAIELIEILKTFLDCKQCIFILAIDYDVVVKGAEKKYGEKGKVFLDKIIQLPYNMPTEVYNIEDYFNELMNRTFSGDFLKDKRKEMLDFMSAAFGTNPRSVNRLINSFYIENYVDDKNVENEISKKEIEEPNYDIKVLLFFLLCLEHVSKTLYNWIISNAELIDKEKSIDGYVKKCSDLDELRKHLDENIKIDLNKVSKMYCDLVKRIELPHDVIFGTISRSNFTGGRINI